MRKHVHKFSLIILLCFIAGLPGQVLANDKEKESFSPAQLDQMMAPIALYPDALLSQVLMASTYPDQVTEAAKWSKNNKDIKGDAAVKAVQDKKWNPSVSSLVAFPQVLDMMSNKPDWVKQMGDAFLADSSKVMATVQSLRKKAKDSGNLADSKQQKITTTGSTIIIESSDPDVVYVPVYDPTIVYGIWWWPAYPPYYYPPPPYYGYSTGFVVGFGVGIIVTDAMWGGFNWGHGNVNINVNHYNNINVNNKINSSNKNVSWKHNGAHSKSSIAGKTANKTTGKNKLTGDAASREDFRGRDAQREQAISNMKSKGFDPAAERSKLAGSSGDSIRNKVNTIDNNRQGSFLSNKSNAASSWNSGSRMGASQFSTKSSRVSSGAFTGLGNNSGLSNKTISNRGASSNQSFKSFGGGGRGFGGGGGRGLGGGGFRGR